MGDRQDGDDRRVIAFARHTEDDNARTILAALFLSGAMFVAPKLCVVQNKTRLRRRNSHARLLPGLKQGVEMLVPLVHFRRGDCANFLFGQIDGCETAPGSARILRTGPPARNSR